MYPKIAIRNPVNNLYIGMFSTAQNGKRVESPILEVNYDVSGIKYYASFRKSRYKITLHSVPTSI